MRRGEVATELGVEQYEKVEVLGQSWTGLNAGPSERKRTALRWAHWKPELSKRLRLPFFGSANPNMNLSEFLENREAGDWHPKCQSSVKME
jgi:hypothetical protein